MVMAVDVRGGGPGTRETDALLPWNLVERVHGLALSGGSVFGLDAASELALLLARDGVGLEVAPGMAVPVVPAAILFDLANGGDKSWAQAAGTEPPYRRLAQEAYAARCDNPAQGDVGAGFGAMAGSRAGGIGIARALLDGGGEVAAIIAVNSFGEVMQTLPQEGVLPQSIPMPKLGHLPAVGGFNTTIGAVATNVPLTRAVAWRLAMMAQDGLARSIRPIHTPFDGDSIFAISLSDEDPVRVDPVLLTELGTRAADCVAQAVHRAVQRSGEN